MILLYRHLGSDSSGYVLVNLNDAHSSESDCRYGATACEEASDCLHLLPIQIWDPGSVR